MRLYYYFGAEIDEKSTQDFMFFLNECNISVKDKALITVYLNSPGGENAAYVAIKEAMESSEIPIHLVGTGLIASCAFMLFYFTNNVIKSLSSTSLGLVHLTTVETDDRESRNPKSVGSVIKHHIDIINEQALIDYKKYKVLTSVQLKEIQRGGDVTLLYEDMYKIMQKCPFGTFLKEGETIYLDDN